jgi:hypothetical protein
MLTNQGFRVKPLNQTISGLKTFNHSKRNLYSVMQHSRIDSIVSRTEIREMD